MNKKIALGSAVVLLGALYGGVTWYAGERAQQRYQEALEVVRKVMGADGVVSQQYQRGFWTSQAQTVLQWTPPAEPAEDGAAPVPATPLRLRLDSTVRHGPLAGFRLAAAVVETRMALDGLDEHARKLLERTSAPTLTVVHHWTGSNDLVLDVPAGEVSEGENLIRWKALRYDMALSADRTRLRGDMQWPELTLRVHEDPKGAQADDEDEAGQEPEVASTMAMAFVGLRGDFDVRIEDGLWLLAPGTSQGRLDKLTVELQEQGAQPKALVALQDMDFKAAIERKDAVFGWNVTMQSKGKIGPMALDSFSLREEVSRIDVEAVRLFQQALVGAYRASAAADAKAAFAPEAPWLATLAQAAPRLLAALPAYAVEIKATVGGKEGSLKYGAQIKSAPDQTLVEERGWGPALLKHSALDASVRLPKAWIPLIAEAVGKPVPAPDELNALLGMAQAQGFLTQETDHIASSVQVDAGQVRLNGKTMQMPQLGGAQ